MSPRDVTFGLVGLLPFVLVLLGWTLLWIISWRRHRLNASSPFDGTPIAVTTIGICLIVIGLVAFAVLTTWFLSPVVIVAMAVVLLSAYMRFRRTEVRYLVWGLAESAEHGIPLVSAARAFASERGGLMRTAARRLADYLDAGMPLSLALTRSSVGASPEVRVAADVGQHTGTLGPSLKQAVEQSTEFERSVGTIAAKFSYLSIIFMTMIFIVTFLMIKIVPVFEDMFSEFGLSLPAATISLIDASRMVVNYWYMLMPLAMVAGLMAVMGLMSYAGLPLRSIPIFGLIFTPIDSVTVLYALASTVGQKQSIAGSLQILAGQPGAGRARYRLQVALQQILQGSHWCNALQQAGFISSAQASVLRAAERTGNLPWALSDMADGILRRAAQRAHGVLNIAFPSVLAGFGLIVFMVAAGILLPLFSLISSLA